jgi:putative transcriptional regulator
LLLQGSFEDEMGTYHAGDFIWLNGKHIHQPVTKTGCVCLTVSSDAIRFVKGVSQLLNPIGQFIY